MFYYFTVLTIINHTKVNKKEFAVLILFVFCTHQQGSSAAKMHIHSINLVTELISVGFFLEKIAPLSQSLKSKNVALPDMGLG